MLVKSYTQFASKFGKLRSGHRTGKHQFPIPKKGSAKECSNYSTIALISHASKIILKIFQAGFRKGRGNRDNLPTSAGSQKKQKNSRKLSTSASLTTLKPLTVWIPTNWKILKEMGIPDHLICFLRNLCAGKDATVRTGHGTTDWFQIEKGVCQGCILSPCLFNLYADCIMQNARLDEAQAGSKTAGRNVSNLRYAYTTTLKAESEEELKSLLMKVKEGESGAEASQAPVTSPTLPQPAPARARTLEAGSAGRGSPRPEQPLGRGSALSRLGADLELRLSGSSLGPSQ